MASFRILEDNIATRVERVKKEKEELGEKSEGTDWAFFWESAVEILSPLALEETGVELPSEYDAPDKWSAYVASVLENLEQKAKTKKEEIGEEDISKVVAISTGIPTGRIQGDEQQKLMDLENYLMARVIGQDDAAKNDSKSHQA
jgi:ATP-dependent Clp protease ATP-binding subunit ClpB